MTDNEIIRKVVDGDTEAFEQIIRRHHPAVHRLVYRLVWNRGEAEDLVQEIFMKVFRNLEKFDRGREFPPWLNTIIINTAMSHLKRRGKHKGQIDFVDEHHQSPGTSPLRTVEGRQELEKAVTALKGLSPDHRMILALRAFEGLSYSEIAGRLQCTPGTVMSRLSRARKKLQNALAKGSWGTKGKK